GPGAGGRRRTLRDRHPPRLRPALLARGAGGAGGSAPLRGGVPHRPARRRRERPGARDEHPAAVAVDAAVVGREGGRAISLGSDAHTPAALAHGFPEAMAMVEAFGFRAGSDPRELWRR